MISCAKESQIKKLEILEDLKYKNLTTPPKSA